MESVEWHSARAALEWQIELGADESIADAPVDRYALPQKTAKKAEAAAKKSGPVDLVKRDAVAEAKVAARGAGTLEELHAAMAAFDLCELKLGARNLVFCDGVAGSRVMVIGESPGREEDRVGRPFVGQAGQMLDRMFAAIGIGRSVAEAPIYITNTLPWRPPQNRDPKPEEIAMMKPFLERHIELAAPEVLVIMGNWACQALMGQRGITRLRGTWVEVLGRPALPMCHPAYLLRMPAAKRETWADLLSVKARLERGA
ncbi:uracil-DNA glycosylase [Sulfitobacter sp. SK012]|uniref:uracil-DNA glycosylase n=1 Tax=Sulfitobacter sp. SK012 TaxID=1389005 RepID=UPI000E0C0F12|nr:uracil-DNA glycosylase [Sulfitobacter sp. SK012]AXI45299.1 uracil-DNA glycosylase [Sulfitobacter sp. SK012]